MAATLWDRGPTLSTPIQLQIFPLGKLHQLGIVLEDFGIHEEKQDSWVQ